MYYDIGSKEKERERDKYYVALEMVRNNDEIKMLFPTTASIIKHSKPATKI